MPDADGHAARVVDVVAPVEDHQLSRPAVDTGAPNPEQHR